MSTIGSSALNIQLSKISASKLRRREARNGISGHGPWGCIQSLQSIDSRRSESNRPDPPLSTTGRDLPPAPYRAAADDRTKSIAKY
jgi:hypothetical protein